MIDVLYAALFGIIAGAVYGIGYFLRLLFNFNKIVTIIVDIIVSVFSGFLFIYCIFTVASGIIRVYYVIAFALGFGIERISVGNLFANILLLIYNKIAKNKKSPKHKKRIAKQKLCQNQNLQQL